MIGECSRCGRIEKIYAKEMCISCYNYVSQSKNPEKVRSRNKRWRDKNTIYFRDYMRKKKNIPKSKWRKE